MGKQTKTKQKEDAKQTHNLHKQTKQLKPSILIKIIHMLAACRVTQVWFWKGCATAKFESRPEQIPNFQEKVTHLDTN